MSNVVASMRARFYNKTSRRVGYIAVAAVNIALMSIAILGETALYTIEFAATFGSDTARMTMCRHANMYVTDIAVLSNTSGSYNNFQSSLLTQDSFADWSATIDCTLPGYVSSQVRMPITGQCSLQKDLQNCSAHVDRGASCNYVDTHCLNNAIDADVFSCETPRNQLMWAALFIILFSGLLALTCVFTAFVDYTEKLNYAAARIKLGRMVEKVCLACTYVSEAIVVVVIPIIIAEANVGVDDSFVVRAVSSMGTDATHHQTVGTAMYMVYISYSLTCIVLFTQVVRLGMAMYVAKTGSSSNYKPVNQGIRFLG